MRRTAFALSLMTALAAAGLDAQETARERAQRTLPLGVLTDLSALAADLEADGVPAEPLYAKALEGAAKRVPPERIVPAVRAFAGRLGEARGALGPGADAPLLVAGADALQRGVSQDALRSLPRDRPRSPMALLVLAELVENGVPTDRALQMLREVMAQRTTDERMLDVSARIRRLIREGVPPQDAIERVRRALQRDRAGSLAPGATPLTRDRLGN